MQPTRYGIVHATAKACVPRRFRIDLLLRAANLSGEIADCPGVKWSRITLPSEFAEPSGNGHRSHVKADRPR